jgi:hypothetical protein
MEILSVKGLNSDVWLVLLDDGRVNEVDAFVTLFSSECNCSTLVS